MTPAEHRAEAERLLTQAARTAGMPDRPALESGQPVGARQDLQYAHSQLVARAHVHALLAQELEWIEPTLVDTAGLAENDQSTNHQKGSPE